jgi:hypothetical protein
VQDQDQDNNGQNNTVLLLPSIAHHTRLEQGQEYEDRKVARQAKTTQDKARQLDKFEVEG